MTLNINHGLLKLVEKKETPFMLLKISIVLIKRVSVTYKCYEMYAHRGKKVQLLCLSLFVFFSSEV